MIRILGIDPGSINTGYGVVDMDGNTPRYVHCGALKVGGEDFPVRLAAIYRGIAGLMIEYAPQEVVVEKVFVNRNADSALKLGQARAAAICGTFAHAVPVFEYTPREIKLAVVGKGGAAKTQVQHMVKLLLNLKGELGSDAGDALAVALCHGFSRAMRARLQAAEHGA